MEGVLLLHKPAGMTSHDCVNKIRKLFSTKKVGHTGTLDPDVSGVLPLCIGKATKIAQFLTAENKTYSAEITLGFSTTTEDASGEIVASKEVSKSLSSEDVKKVLEELTGEIEQTPPMYSAVKVNGRKLYEYAREGIEVERPTRTITIHQMDLTSDIEWNGQNVSFRIDVTCSKGTYIRTLAVMIGEKLGYPAHMSHLIRTKSGTFVLDDCLTFEELENILPNPLPANSFLTMNDALNHLPKWTINDTLAKKVKNGAVLSVPDDWNHQTNRPIRVIHNGECIALYTIHPTKENLVKPLKVFH